nr:glutamine-hydrolyzing GMP synthase [Leptospiraceae bacterium]
THHNRSQAVLDLPEKGLVVEPLKELYKDEVRELGSLLGLSMDIIERHPFPGPGLAVRMIASAEDNEFEDREQSDRLIAHYKDAQYKILPLKSVGVQGDSRSYRHCALLNDFTRSWHEYRKVSTDITNHIRGINRVVFAPFQRNLPDNLKFSQIFLDKSHSDLLRDADFIVSKILKKRGISQEIWQMPVVLIPVGKKKGRFSIVLRPVESMEAMTANFYPMRRKFLKEIVKSLKKLKKISWVFYDITDKPPGTIEWE